MTQYLTPQQIREKFEQRRKRIQMIDTVFPGLEELEGQLAIQSLSPAETEQAEKLGQVNGKSSQSVEWGALVCKAVVTSYEPHSRIFSDKMASIVAGYDMDIIMPLVIQIQEHSKMTKEAVDEAKKNLKKTPEKSSNTTSHSESEEDEQETN